MLIPISLKSLRVPKVMSRATPGAASNRMKSSNRTATELDHWTIVTLFWIKDIMIYDIII